MSPPSSPQPDPAGPLAGLDPGRSKCGLVRTDVSCLCVVEACVLDPEACFEKLQDWWQQGLINAVVMGNGTGSQAWRTRLADHLRLHMLDESGTTLEARRRYWELEPVRGWHRLLPKGLRQPPRDWDDVVAQLLLERWLGHALTRRPSL